MKRVFILLFLFVGTMVSAYCNYLTLADSVGMTSKGGERYIIHEVEAGETLFALSRRYNVTVQKIKDSNDAGLNNLTIGQKVLVPYLKKENTNSSDLHVVQSSETLFSISRNYNVQVEDLRKWNQLADNNISIGQKLIVIAPTALAQASKVTATTVSNRATHKVEVSQTLYSISRMYGVTSEQLREWNNLSSNSLNVGQLLIVSSNAGPAGEVKTNSSMLPAQEAVNQQKVTEESQTVRSEEKKSQTVKVVPPATTPIVINENMAAGKMEAPAEKMVKKGMAEVIEDSSDTKKYLALHREASIGTIMQVKNEMNNQTVFVRVVGTIPNTGDNAKVILKISKKAYDRLGAVDSRFPVELSYIP